MSIKLRLAEFCDYSKFIRGYSETTIRRYQQNIGYFIKVSSIKDVQERNKQGYQTPYLFVSSTIDREFTNHGLKHLVDKICRESGVKFHVHQLRHTFAINLVNNGCGEAKLKQLMGHRDIRMTATYLRCFPTKAMRGDIESLSIDSLL